MDEPTIVEREASTIVGLPARYEGDDSVIEATWKRFGERWADFEPLAADDAVYGVVTNYEPGTTTFDYLVGVASASPDEEPADFDAIEVPAGTYAVFRTSLPSFESDNEAVTGEWLPDSDYERRVAPELERFGPDHDPDAPDSPYDYYLPVRPTE